MAALRLALCLTLTLSLVRPAVAESRCTRDVLRLNAAAVTAAFCIPAGGGPPSVAVVQTFVSGGRTLARTTTFPVVAGAAVSRTIDDVDLTPLGLRGTLHMTLVYRRGSVELEHALALPGAIPVK